MEAAKSVTANSIRKTFDLINVHFRILCNITAQTQFRLVMAESHSNEQSNVHENPS